MSLPRFFLDDQVLSEETEDTFALRLSEDDLHHAKVLRLLPGEHIAVIDGSSDYFECEIASLDDAMIVFIASKGEGSSSLPLIAVYQALAKGDKVDAVIRHATEVGATSFVPFSTARSVVKLDGPKAQKKRERWQAIAKSAAMQSGRRVIPEVHPVETFTEACASLSIFDCVIVFWEEAEGSQSLSSALSCVKDYNGNGSHPMPSPCVAMVVGPEGGLTDEEVEALLASNPNAALATLGPSILRTETAGIVGCALVSYELGGMDNAPHGEQG